MWGVNTFDNDRAIDWLTKFQFEGDFTVIPKMIEKYNKLDTLDEVVLDECTELMAAIEILASAKTDNFKTFPSEKVDYFTNADFAYTMDDFKNGLKLLQKLRTDSEIRELYLDSPLLKHWEDYVKELEVKLL